MKLKKRVFLFSSNSNYNKPIIRIIKIKPKLPSHITALNRIEEIKGDKSLRLEGNTKEYYTQLTDTLREYMRDRYGFNATEMTTSEIVGHLLKIQDKESIKDLKEILQVADLVKFAKLHPSINENDRNMANAIEFVNETKNIEEVLFCIHEAVVYQWDKYTLRDILKAGIP